MSVRIPSLSFDRAAQIYRARSILPSNNRSDPTSSLPKDTAAKTKSDSVHFSNEAMEKAKLLKAEELEEINRRQRLQQDQDEQLRRSQELLDPKTKASLDAIKRAYRYLISHYHPDKYTDLPPEFRALAETKSRQIIQAYKILTK